MHLAADHTARGRKSAGIGMRHFVASRTSSRGVRFARLSINPRLVGEGLGYIGSRSEDIVALGAA
jgi:hypothetical protein